MQMACGPDEGSGRLYGDLPASEICGYGSAAELGGCDGTDGESPADGDDVSGGGEAGHTGDEDDV